MKFRNDIQGLRAIAVLLVFIFHLNKEWLPGGFVGVDVFFVISGYLITQIIHKKIEVGQFSLKDFYMSRVARIVPAYFFMTFVVSLASICIIFSFDIEKILRKELLYVVGFASNVYFSSLGTYFGASLLENPFLHTWTLGVEMQYYFILPFLLLFLNKSRKFITPLLIIAILLFGWASYQIYINNEVTATYFSLIARMPEFLLGGVIGFINIGDVLRRKAIQNALSFVGIFIIMYCSISYSEATLFPGATAVLPCTGAALLLLTPESRINTFLGKSGPAYIGEISYSIYLWHWPVMALTRYYYSTERFDIFQLILCVMLTILLSLLSYYSIERPLRNARRPRLFQFLVPVTAFCVSIPFFAKWSSSRIHSLPAPYVRPTLGLLSHNNDLIETFGSTTAQDTSIFLTGNSHALVIKEYLDYMGRELNFSFKTVTSDKYPPLYINKDSLSKERDFSTEYYAISQKLSPSVNSQIKKSRLIFMCVSSLSQLPIRQSIIEVASSLESNQKLVLLNTFPTLNGNPIKINRGVIRNKSFAFEKYKDTSIVDLMHTIKRGNVYVFDLSNSAFFNDAPYYKDTVTYYDNGHLNSYGTLKLAQQQKAEFEFFYRKISN